MILQGANHPPELSLAFSVYNEQERKSFARKEAKSLYKSLYKAHQSPIKSDCSSIPVMHWFYHRSEYAEAN